MPRLRFSTATLVGEEVVPWLASVGELAYNPHLPPDRDYFFQYSWIIPGIFCAGTKARRHFWFGSPHKDSPEVRLLFAFWNRARQGDVNELFVSNGTARPADVTAPLAVYCHPAGYSSMAENLIFIQHGSYLIADNVRGFLATPHTARRECGARECAIAGDRETLRPSA